VGACPLIILVRTEKIKASTSLSASAEAELTFRLSCDDYPFVEAGPGGGTGGGEKRGDLTWHVSAGMGFRKS